MIIIRPSQERGKANFSWLESYHTFSFGGYSDPHHMGFGSLRVINEDYIAPEGGFNTHGHQNMEIVTYVLEGALEHRDSLGTGSVIRPGDIQRMSAGTGIRHSEFNASKTDPVHLLQIWILPDRNGIEPSYEQKNFAESDRQGKLCLLGSRDGRDGSIVIHQDINFYGASLKNGDEVIHSPQSGRSTWIQVTRGSIHLKGQTLQAGDGAAIDRESCIDLKGDAPQSELLLFDMAGAA